MGPSTTLKLTCVWRPTAHQRAARTLRWDAVPRETRISSGSLSGRRDDGRRGEKVAGNLKWPSFTIVQLLQWTSSLQDRSPFEWEWRANERWWNSHFKPMNHPIQSFCTHVNDWISADRGGANENLQGDVYLVFLRRAAELETFAFIQVPLRPERSPAHIWSVVIVFSRLESSENLTEEVPFFGRDWRIF